MVITLSHLLPATLLLVEGKALELSSWKILCGFSPARERQLEIESNKLCVLPWQHQVPQVAAQSSGISPILPSSVFSPNLLRLCYSV